MELQDLKSIWTKVVDAESIKYEIDRNGVQALIKKQSNITISKIKRELQFKRWFFGFIGILTPFLALVFYYDNDSTYFLDDYLTKFEVSLLLFLMGIIILIAFINIIVSYRTIGKFQKSSDNLKTTLQEVIKILGRVIKFGIYSDAIGVPVFATWILYRILFKSEIFIFDIRVFYLAITAIILFIIKYNIGKFLQNRKYNPYIKSLQRSLNDIDLIEKEAK
ncbi:hypothetical protein D7030_11240 [Flavobacteriaceae bacterium AU392]|nr:hypothetical protein D1817_13430 [Flavobacteriaceae bacterium]RKM82735.1 hypothetical protein D7030_11240 [Flavobacteriaceae bacterium AU392]